MLPGHIQNSFAEILSPMIDPEHRSEAGQPDIYCAIIGLVGETVRNSACQRSTYAGSIFVVEVIKNCAGGQSDQLRENLFDRVEISIKIQVLLLDIYNQRVLGLKERDRAVALIPFGNEILSARIPVCVRSQNRNLCADIMAG